METKPNLTFKKMQVPMGIAAVTAAMFMPILAHADNDDGKGNRWYYKDAVSEPDSTQVLGSRTTPVPRYVTSTNPLAPVTPPVTPPASDSGYVADSGGGGYDGVASDAPGDNAGDGGDGGSGCFLTTATTQTMNKPDDCKELTMARYLRDHKMTSSKDRSTIDLYYKVAPTIVKRKSDWADFYSAVLAPLTQMVEQGQYESAIRRYKIETVRLIYQHIDRREDVEEITAIHEHIFGRVELPYEVKFDQVRTTLKQKLSLVVA